MTRPRTAWWARRVAGGIPVLVLVAGLAIMAGLSVLVVQANQEHQESLQATDTSLLTIPTIAPAAEATTTTTPAAEAPTTAAEPTTTIEPTTSAATTEPASTAPTTPPTTPATTEAPVVEATTVAPTEPPTAPPTTRPSDGRVVAITSRVGACSFGPRCLIAGFKLTGFPKAPTAFVCEFADGSRNTFRVGVTEVKQACSTSKVPDSITIEVDGVRSETVTTG